MLSGDTNVRRGPVLISGEFNEGMLYYTCLSLHETKRSGKLEFSGAGHSGLAVFLNGEIVHAEWEDQRGQDALNLMVRVEQGNYRFYPLPLSSLDRLPRTLHSSFQNAMMQTALLLDEQEEARRGVRNVIDHISDAELFNSQGDELALMQSYDAWPRPGSAAPPANGLYTPTQIETLPESETIPVLNVNPRSLTLDGETWHVINAVNGERNLKEIAEFTEMELSVVRQIVATQFRIQHLIFQAPQLSEAFWHDLEALVKGTVGITGTMLLLMAAKKTGIPTQNKVGSVPRHRAQALLQEVQTLIPDPAKRQPFEQATQRLKDTYLR